MHQSTERARRSTHTLAGVMTAFLLLAVTTLSFGAEAASAAEPSAASLVDISATPTGYLVLHSDGTIDATNTAHLGDVDLPQAAALSATPSGNGYWIAGANGSVHTFGDAASAGDLSHLTLAQPIIAMATTASGQARASPTIRARLSANASPTTSARPSRNTRKKVG